MININTRRMYCLAFQSIRNKRIHKGLYQALSINQVEQRITLLTTKTTVTRRKRKKNTSYLNNGGNERNENEFLNVQDSTQSFLKTNTNILKTNNHLSTEINNVDNTELTFDEYLEIASLSPWVPTPDPVARRMLEIAQAGSQDIHYDLGSGDGRLNFMAIDVPFNVKQSTGIEIDDSLLEASNTRLQKRHPSPTNLHFVKADLLPPNEKLLDEENKPSALEHNYPVDISNATIVTMYFVEDALKKLKPMLQHQLFRTGCRVITCGYDIDGWEPRWVEIVLGLPVYMYILDDEMSRTEDTFLSQPNQKENDYAQIDGTANDGNEVDDSEEMEFEEVDDFDNGTENKESERETAASGNHKHIPKWKFSK